MLTATILVYGHNLHLLAARVWLLEEAGFTVFEASDYEQAEELAFSTILDAVVVCHSVPAEDCWILFGALHELRPSTKRLQLPLTSGCPEIHFAKYSRACGIVSGFVQSVQDLLQRPSERLH